MVQRTRPHHTTDAHHGELGEHVDHTLHMFAPRPDGGASHKNAKEPDDHSTDHFGSVGSPRTGATFANSDITASLGGPCPHGIDFADTNGLFAFPDSLSKNLGQAFREQ
ncbi:MAG: hypothetical protein R3C01_02860 [Planctomycetaceae bacterium]